jgi:hypothetical protein
LVANTLRYKYASVLNALERWATQKSRDPARTYIWICAMCMNQFRITERVVASEELVAEFAPRVLAIGLVLPMLEPWCVCRSTPVPSLDSHFTFSQFTLFLATPCRTVMCVRTLIIERVVLEFPTNLTALNPPR